MLNGHMGSAVEYSNFDNKPLGSTSPRINEHGSVNIETEIEFCACIIRTDTNKYILSTAAECVYIVSTYV